MWGVNANTWVKVVYSTDMYVIMLSVCRAPINDLTAGWFENQKEALNWHVMTGVRFESQGWVLGLHPKDHSGSITNWNPYSEEEAARKEHSILKFQLIENTYSSKIQSYLLLSCTDMTTVIWLSGTGAWLFLPVFWEFHCSDNVCTCNSEAEF